VGSIEKGPTRLVGIQGCTVPIGAQTPRPIHTLAGVEAMAMLAKGQVRGVSGNDMPAQRAFVHRIFGLAV
jgi:hypothetical protein